MLRELRCEHNPSEFMGGNARWVEKVECCCGGGDASGAVEYSHEGGARAELSRIAWALGERPDGEKRQGSKGQVANS